MARPSGFSPVLLALLAIGLAGGAAASFVVSSSQPYAHGGSLSNFLVSPTVLIVILLFPLVAGYGSILFLRARGGRMPIPPALVILALLSYAPQNLGSLGGAPGGGPGHSTPVNNSSSNTSSGTGSAPATPLLPSLPAPSWLIFVVVAVIALAAIGLGVPAARSISQRRGVRAAFAVDERHRAAATAAFGQALDDLAGGADPRLVVERLYVQLIARLPRPAGDVDPLTPEEIRVESLLPLGIRPAAANEITRIFEEARYSSHPINAAQAARVKAAFGLAWADLSGSAPAR
ncbi:MAG TPA: DUF4129 domain-containing protein [Thermoplasmata archaeon]|nr:DUF4129 domain-containing protein [Thermoplasmata archaeon]